MPYRAKAGIAKTSSMAKRMYMNFGGTRHFFGMEEKQEGDLILAMVMSEEIDVDVENRAHTRNDSRRVDQEVEHDFGSSLDNDDARNVATFRARCRTSLDGHAVERKR